MKYLFLTWILASSLIGEAQKPTPRIENDTLFTKSGYNLYPGLMISFGKGSSNGGNFRFVYIEDGSGAVLKPEYGPFKVIKIEELKVSNLYNIYAKMIIEGSKPGATKLLQKKLILNLKAMEDAEGKPSEMIVPEEFKKNGSVADEISKLFQLYKDGAITKDEYELEKKKLLAK